VHLHLMEAQKEESRYLEMILKPLAAADRCVLLGLDDRKAMCPLGLPLKEPTGLPFVSTAILKPLTKC